MTYHNDHLDHFDQMQARVIAQRLANLGGAYIGTETHPRHGDTVFRVRWPDGVEEVRYGVAILQRIQDIEEGEAPRTRPNTLRDALRRYGQHDTGCKGRYGSPCTCGFAEALHHQVFPEEAK